MGDGPISPFTGGAFAVDAMGWLSVVFFSLARLVRGYVGTGMAVPAGSVGVAVFPAPARSFDNKIVSGRDMLAASVWLGPRKRAGHERQIGFGSVGLPCWLRVGSGSAVLGLSGLGWIVAAGRALGWLAGWDWAWFGSAVRMDADVSGWIVGLYGFEPVRLDASLGMVWVTCCLGLRLFGLDPAGFGSDEPESLILAQSERWRHA